MISLPGHCSLQLDDTDFLAMINHCIQKKKVDALYRDIWASTPAVELYQLHVLLRWINVCSPVDKMPQTALKGDCESNSKLIHLSYSICPTQ